MKSFNLFNFKNLKHYFHQDCVYMCVPRQYQEKKQFVDGAGPLYMHAA